VVAGSVWGGGGPNGFVGTWRTTANGLEGLAVGHSGTCLILDELAEIDPKEAASAVYSLAHGHGKARAGKGGEARARAEWRVSILSSGEIGLAEKIAEDRNRLAKAGMDVRLVDLTADAGGGHGVFNELHGRANGAVFADELSRAARSVYGCAGLCFVQEIAKDRDKLTEALRLEIDRVEAELTTESAGGQAARVARRFAIVGVTGEFAREALGLPWDEGESISAASRLYQEWLQRRGGHAPAEISRAKQAIRDAINRDGPSRFEDVRFAASSDRVIHRRLGWRAVIRDVDCWAFSTGGWREILSGIADPSWVAKQLAEEGFVLGDAEKGGQIVWKIGGNPTRLIAVPVAELSEGDHDG
jgi:putative DNA primase/helicase